MKTVAIIPARGGSKRIPRKNIKTFLGQPIIGYSIKAAVASCIFEEVIVSTDDREIADIAEGLGASVPFFRSNDTSGDFATVSDVVLEVIGRLEKQGKVYDAFCCIYPTAPFVTAELLVEASELLFTKDVDSVIPIVQFSFPILRSFCLDDSGLIKMNWPEYLNIRSQDLTPAFHDAGQFYFVKTAGFLEEKKILMERSYGLVIPETRVQDIDNEDDWKIAEMKFQIINDITTY